MKSLFTKVLCSLSIFSFTLLSLGACDRNRTTGDKIEDAADKAGDKVEDAGDKAEEKLDK